MTELELDTVYTALAESIGCVGEAATPLFLSTLCLSLLAKQEDADAALTSIVQAQALVIDNLLKT